MNHFRFLTTLGLMLGLCSNSPATDESENSLMERVMSPSHLYEALDADSDYFKSLSPKELDKITVHKSDRVAIVAAWKRVANSVESDDRRVLEHAAERFLGYIEGRLRTTIPDWWRTTLLSVDGKTAFQYFPDIPETPHFYPLEQGSSVWRNPHAQETEIELIDGNLLFRTSPTKFTVPVKRFDHLSPRYSGVASTDQGKRLIVAVLGVDGHGYPLFCVNTKTWEIEWRAEVWAAGPIVQYEGRFGMRPSLCEFIVRENDVLVFGAASDGIYVESFRLTDGKNLLRFGSAY